MRYLLQNPLSTNALSPAELKHKLREIDNSKELKVINVVELTDKKAFLDSLNKEDDIVVCGGDGTLNHLINDYDFLILKTIFIFISLVMVTIF